MPGQQQPQEEILPLEDIDDGQDPTDDDLDDGDVEGFDFDTNLLGGAFDPMMTIAQFVTTQNGETIPDILEKINQTLSTLTKVLHKISKTLDK